MSYEAQSPRKANFSAPRPTPPGEHGGVRRAESRPPTDERIRKAWDALAVDTTQL